MRAAIAIAEALFSRGFVPPAAERLSYLASELEDFLARAGTRTRLMLSFMVVLVTYLAPLFVRRFGSLSSLSVGDRIRALTALEQRFAEPLLGVKAMLCLLYYEHPEAAREIGYDGTCLVPRVGVRLPTVAS